MNFEQCTELSRSVIRASVERARSHRHAQVGPEHLLLSLCLETDSLVLPLVEGMGVSLGDFQQKVTGLVSALPRQEGGTADPRLGRSLASIFESALNEARTLGDSHVATEHLFLGIT